MCTTILLVALSGFTAQANVDEAPSWLTDYSEARKQGQSEKKPLAVFVSSGKNGWNKVAKDGELGKEVAKTLTDSYVCVYVDSATDAGKRLASALSLENGKGLVISDSSGRIMAYHHDGDLANRALGEVLTRFADPERAVQHTESTSTTVRSYYPPSQPVQQQPAPFSNFGGGGGRSC